MTMTFSHDVFHVARAHAGQITDQTLDTVGAIAATVEQGTALNDEQAQLILLTLRPIVDELRQRRAAADVIKDLLTPGNVLLMQISANAPAA